MRILWFTWKDRKNPSAGGAELVNEELAKRLVVEGHEVIFLTAGFPGCAAEEIVNGYKIVRLGNKWTVYWHAFLYYRKNLNDWPDLVIDEVNTIPFFAKFYVKQKNILFVYQLCRGIWFYQMFFPLSLAGYIIEPFYIWLLRDRRVVTVSDSTKKDLMRFGFRDGNIKLISAGIEIEPVEGLDNIKKYDIPTILSLGSVRPMKRTDQILRAFEILKKSVPNAQLIIAGDSNGSYGQRLVKDIDRLSYNSSIKYLGKISREQKRELLQRSHVLAVTSVKEGWGLVVTEANSQGTPAVVYNVDGLRDSVRDGQTGLVCIQNTPEDLAKNMTDLLKNKGKYQNLCENAWQWSKEISFDNSYGQFIFNLI